MSVVFYPFVWGSNFPCRIEEWGKPVHYIRLLLKVSEPKLVLECCLYFPLLVQIFLVFFFNILFIFIGNFTTEIFTIFLVAVNICYLQWFYIWLGLFLKKATVFDFSGDISFPNFFAVFCNVNSLNQLLWLDRLQKENVFVVVVDKVIPVLEMCVPFYYYFFHVNVE